MKNLQPRRLTTAGLLSLLFLTAQVTPALSTTRFAPARGINAAAQTQATLAESLPESDILLVVDYKRLFDDAFPRWLAELGEQREGAVKLVDETAAITGLDLRAVGRVVTGVRMEEVAGGKEPARRTTVSLARGVNQEKWLAFMRQKRSASFKESRQGSRTLHLLSLTAAEKITVEAVTLSTIEAEGLAFATLDADTLAYGSPAGVRAALDARAGSGAKIKAELVAAAARNPNALFSVTGPVPPSLVAEFLPAENKEGNEYFKMLSNVQRVSFAVELAPAGLTGKLDCSVGNVEQAKALGDIVTAVKTFAVFAQAKSTRDKLGVELLKSLTVTTEGDEVRVKSELSDATVRGMVRWNLSDDYFKSGAAHKLKGEVDAALADYDKAITIDPENVYAYLARGTAHMAKGEFEAAEADGNKALSLDPGNATAYNNRGFARIEKGDYEAAIVDLKKAIELDPALAYAHNNLGHARAALGHYEEALADYDKSIALDPENAFAYHNRGQTRYELGEHARAIADYDKALALDPKMTEAYNGRGHAHTALGEYEVAVADHDKALALDPKSADGYGGRGIARFNMDELDAALADYDKAIALDPKPPAYYYSNRGFAHASKDAFVEALIDFNKAVEVNPKLVVGYQGRGYVRYQQGEYAAAVIDFDKVISLDPEFAEAYGYRGLALLAQQKDAAAARDLKKCFELDESLRDFFEELAKEIVVSRGAKSRRTF